MSITEKYSVRPITYEDCKPWVLKRHYAKRMPPISYAYGCFEENLLVGIVSYGVPLSSTLRTGVCGEENQDRVLELNRLCCKNEKNLASYLVSSSLKLLPAPKIVVSYADSAQGHVGYVYQATNFLYTGLTAKMYDWKVEGRGDLHHCSIGDEFRGQEDRANKMREKYGDSLYKEERSQKHRYVIFVGSKSERKKMNSDLRYKVESYPKGDIQRYDTSEPIVVQSSFC
jgi:hypothetical protein